MAISPHLETSHLPVWPSHLTWRHLTYLCGRLTSPGDISPTCKAISRYIWSPGDISPTCVAVSPHLETSLLPVRPSLAIYGHPETSHLPVWPSHLTLRHLTYLYGRLTSPGDISPPRVAISHQMEGSHLNFRDLSYLHGHLTSPGEILPTYKAISPHLETSHLPVWSSHLTWRHLSYL